MQPLSIPRIDNLGAPYNSNKISLEDYWSTRHSIRNFRILQHLSTEEISFAKCIEESFQAIEKVKLKITVMPHVLIFPPQFSVLIFENEIPLNPISWGEKTTLLYSSPRDSRIHFELKRNLGRSIKLIFPKIISLISKGRYLNGHVANTALDWDTFISINCGREHVSIMKQGGEWGGIYSLKSLHLRRLTTPRQIRP